MINLLWERKWLVQSKLNNEIVYSFVGLKYLNVISSTLLLLLALWCNMDRDGNHRLELRVWSVKYCRRMVLGRGFLGSYICGLRRTNLCGTGTFAGWDETGHAKLHGPVFFSFLILLEKMRESVRRKRFLWLSPKNIRSSGDDDSELRWWWFEIRRWGFQLQRWWFKLWWCFDFVFSFYYTQLWITLL